MFIIIKERMFVNTKYEQIFETFVCVPVGFMVKFIWYILSKYRIERGDYPNLFIRDRYYPNSYKKRNDRRNIRWLETKIN